MLRSFRVKGSCADEHCLIQIFVIPFLPVHHRLRLHSICKEIGLPDTHGGAGGKLLVQSFVCPEVHDSIIAQVAGTFGTSLIARLIFSVQIPIARFFHTVLCVAPANAHGDLPPAQTLHKAKSEYQTGSAVRYAGYVSRKPFALVDALLLLCGNDSLQIRDLRRHARHAVACAGRVGHTIVPRGCRRRCDRLQLIKSAPVLLDFTTQPIKLR